MNPNTGEILHLSDEDWTAMEREYHKTFNEREGRMMSLENRLVSLTDEEAEKLEPLDKRQRKGWMRNQPCPCGSGAKFKKCCWSKFR